jgi:plasmid stability protein
MSTITLKNVPAAVHRVLKSRARSHGRSLNKEVIAALEQTLHSSRVDASSVLKHARSVRETIGVYLTERDLTKLKNTGRR